MRQGISKLFPRVQTFNRVTLFKILLINLKQPSLGNGHSRYDQEALSTHVACWQSVEIAVAVFRDNYSKKLGKVVVVGNWYG